MSAEETIIEEPEDTKEQLIADLMKEIEVYGLPIADREAFLARAQALGLAEKPDNSLNMRAPKVEEPIVEPVVEEPVKK